MIEQLIKAINADNTKEALALVDKMTLSELNVVGNEEQMPLHVAATKNNLQIIKTLLLKGVDVNVEAEDKSTALFAAAMSGCFEVAKELVDRGAIVKAKDITGATPLFYSKTKLIAELLLKSGSGVDDVVSMDQSCLHFIATFGKAEVIEFLLANGANKFLNSKDLLGQTPIILCSTAENTLAFLKAGANVKSVANNGENALTHAATNGALDVIKVLLQTEIKELINTPRADGATPLLCAAPSNRGFPKVVDKSTYASVMEVLVKNGANINYQNPKAVQQTALMVAIDTESKPAVETLVKLGANLGLTDRFKQTAMDYAKKANLTDIIKLLEVGEKADQVFQGTVKATDVLYENVDLQKLFEQRLKVLKNDGKVELEPEGLSIDELVLSDDNNKSEKTEDTSLVGADVDEN